MKIGILYKNKILFIIQFRNFAFHLISKIYIKKKKEKRYLRMKDYICKNEFELHEKNNICVNQSYISHFTSNTWKKDFARQYWFNDRVNNDVYNLQVEHT